MGISCDAEIAYGFDLGEFTDWPEVLTYASGAHRYFDEDLLPDDCGVSVHHHSHYDSNYYILAVDGTHKCASWGTPEKFTSFPEITTEQIAKLEAFCKQFGLPFKTPEWLLFATMS